MQSAWSEGAAIANAEAGGPARLARWLRRWLVPAELPTVALVLAVGLVVAGSTVAMEWVKGSEIFPGMAALGVLLMSVLALVRLVPALLALPAGLAASVLVPYYVNQAALK